MNKMTLKNQLSAQFYKKNMEPRQSTKHFVCENLLVEKIEFEEKVSRPPYEREFEGICKLSQIVGWAVHKLHLESSINIILSIST